MSKEEIELAGFIIAALSVLSSAAIGFFSLRYSYKTRIDSKADFIYEKKIEAYSELFPLFATFQGICISFLRKAEGPLEGEMLTAFKKHTSLGYANCNNCYRKWSFFLPSQVNYLAISYLNSYSMVTRHPEAKIISEDGSERELGDPEKELTETIFKFFNEARRDLGVEALSLQTRTMIENNAGAESWSLTWDNKNIPDDFLKKTK